MGATRTPSGLSKSETHLSPVFKGKDPIMCPTLTLIIAPQEPMPDEKCLDPIVIALSNRG